MNKNKYAIVPAPLLEQVLTSGCPIAGNEHAAIVELQKLLANSTELQMTPDLRFILSRPSFSCEATAQVLRRLGREISERAEDEQAATIHWMLNHYLRDPLNWRKNSLDEFNAAAALMNATDL